MMDPARIKRLKAGVLSPMQVMGLCCLPFLAGGAFPVAFLVGPSVGQYLLLFGLFGPFYFVHRFIWREYCLAVLELYGE